MSPRSAGVSPGNVSAMGSGIAPVTSATGASAAGGGAASTTGSGELFHHAGALVADSQPASHGAHKAATAITRATRTPIGYPEHFSPTSARAAPRLAAGAGYPTLG